MAYPKSDSEQALKEIAASRRLLLRDLDLVIGESAGGYLVVADCASSGGDQPDPEDLAAGMRPLCIPKVGSNPRVDVCAPDVEMQKAFWGKYKNTSLNDILSEIFLVGRARR